MTATRSYPCVIVNVIDGDTIDVEVDHGFNVYTRQRIRLAGVDCPELGTPEGRAAKAAVLNWCEHPMATLVSHAQKDRYGRRIADLVNGSGSLSAYLLDNGHASVWPKQAGGSSSSSNSSS